MESDTSLLVFSVFTLIMIFGATIGCIPWKKIFNSIRLNNLEKIKKIARSGNVEAMYQVAEIYESGKIIIIDVHTKTDAYFNALENADRNALNWYVRAAQCGHVGALMFLAKYFEDDKMDLNTALELYRFAAQRGCVEAQRRVNILEPQVMRNKFNF